MNNQQSFFKNDFLSALWALKTDTQPQWGIMSAQHMVEHMISSIQESNGKIHSTVFTPAEQLPGYRNFLFSDKPFRPNTKNPALTDTLQPLKHIDLASAINELQAEINDFFIFFGNDPEKRTIHAIFGELNQQEWLHMHYKHGVHHLKQFGLMN